MISRLWTALLIALVVVGVLLGLTIGVFQNSILLGLDLQGGTEVVLQPTEGQDYEGEDLDTARKIISNRVNGLGVAEPDITRQGDNIVVQLPGVDDQERAIDLIGQTAELTFRPVLDGPSYVNSDLCIPGNAPPPPDEEDVTEEEAVEEAVSEDGEAETAPDDNAEATEEETDTADEPTSAADETTDEAVDTDESGAEETVSDETDTADEATDPEESTTEPETEPIGPVAPEESDIVTSDAPDIELTADAFVEPETAEDLTPTLDLATGAASDPQTASLSESVIFCSMGDGPAEPADPDSAFNVSFVARYLLGPAEVSPGNFLTGAAIESASATFTGVAEWYVSLTMRPGEEGIDMFNDLANRCYFGHATCPPLGDRGNGIMAIVLDGNVESAPQVNAAGFERDQIIIQGGFSEREARDLALVLRYGALPIEFDDPAESGLVRSVSATLGRDSLRAGMIAGIIGISLVAIYMIFYYRLLGLLAIISLALSGATLFVVVAFLSEWQGLALTLAGITGLIVSLGVSLDSNVVYFENLKESIASGRTLLSSVSQTFPVAYKTIFWANLATLIMAGVLYFFATSSVRGFAAMLAIASVLDLLATYFFLRPATRLVANSKFGTHRWMGLPVGIQTAEELGGSDFPEKLEPETLEPEVIEVVQP